MYCVSSHVFHLYKVCKGGFSMHIICKYIHCFHNESHRVLVVEGTEQCHTPFYPVELRPAGRDLY